jgi:protein-S-isoprenylcysteine O-methyltransferase Ste14
VADLWRLLARWRVPLGYVLGAAVLWLADPTWRSLGIGAVVGGFGEALRIWAAGHLEKGREVTSTGPYALTRHPLYAGSCIMGAGFAIASRSVVVTLLVAGYLGVTILAAVRSEEAHLTQKFGETYPAYRDGRAARGARRFSFERAWRNREHRALTGFAAVLGVLAVRLLMR